MIRRIARLMVSPEILVEALHLPKGTRILLVTSSEYNDSIGLTIESDTLEEIPEGEFIPNITAVMESRAVYEVNFKEWKK